MRSVPARSRICLQADGPAVMEGHRGQRGGAAIGLIVLSDAGITAEHGVAPSSQPDSRHPMASPLVASRRGDRARARPPRPRTRRRHRRAGPRRPGFLRRSLRD